MKRRAEKAFNSFYVFPLLHRDICKKIMIERSVQMDGGSNGSNSSTKRAVRPTDLPTENRQRRMRHGEFVTTWTRRLNLRLTIFPTAAQSFPTPMEEPKKILRAQYLGCSEVQQAVGMNTINDAIEKISSEVAPDSWTSVNVSISPSMIAVRPNGVREKH